MRKGISPLIASVLLMAFTLSIAMLAGPFFSQTIKDTQEGTSQTTDKIVAASELGLEIKSVVYDGFEDQIAVSIQNTGQKKVNNLTLTFLGSTPVQKSFDTPLKPSHVISGIYNLSNPSSVKSVEAALDNYPVRNQKELSCRMPKPAEEKRFIVNNRLANQNMEVVSYSNKNSITAGSCSNVVGEGDTHTFSSSCYSVGDTVTADHAFSAQYHERGAPGPVPEEFAGTEFAYEECRGSEAFNIFSPYSDAAVTIRNSSGVVTSTTVPAGTGKEIITNMPTGDHYVISSDQPVMVTYDDDSGRDFYMMKPVSDNLLGMMEDIIVSKDNTQVNVYDSNGNTLTSGVYNKYERIGGPDSSQGGSRSVHAVANQSALGGSRCADGDNSETDVGIAEQDMATIYRLPFKMEGLGNNNGDYYITATLKGGGKCTIFSKKGNKLGSKTGNQNAPYPSHISFNSEDDFNISMAGAEIRCSKPAAVQWEPSEFEGESNLFGTEKTPICQLN